MLEEREANVNQHVAIIRTQEDKLNPFFLSYVLNSRNLQQQIDDLQTGASRQGLNFAKIKELKIPFPPIDEQRGIVKIIDTELAALKSIRLLQYSSKRSIERILGRIWARPYCL